MEKTSADRVGNCGQQHRFEERDAHVSVRHVRKNRRAAPPRVTEDFIERCDQTESARTVCQGLHREAYYSVVAVHKALITKMNTDLRVFCCKNHNHRSTEM